MNAAGVLEEWGEAEGRRAPGPAPTRPERLRRGVAVAVCTLLRPDGLVRFLESLAGQTRPPDQIVVVDASPDTATEEALKAFAARRRTAREVVYVRVGRPLVGLTRQRNQALARVTTDLVAFFDDDIVLGPRCLEEMERVHRDEGRSVGVAAAIENERSAPSLLWRTRRILGIVSTLEPGRYVQSGMSIPWGFLPAGTAVREGDWLPGGATMWKTEIARRLGFEERFEGYGQSEDLEFSLRAGREGRLLLAPAARVRHEHVAAGRPNAFRKGYMAIYNRYVVHRRNRESRGWSGFAFAYGWTLDTLLLARHALIPSRWSSTLGEIAGRVRATWDIVAGR